VDKKSLTKAPPRSREVKFEKYWYDREFKNANASLAIRGRHPGLRDLDGLADGLSRAILGDAREEDLHLSGGGFRRRNG
jgi:hypothetical protein